MPQIPVYETQQVEERALPGVRQSSVASPALFGAQAEEQVKLGKGILNAGNEIRKEAALIQERENADMIFRAETSLKDDYLKYEQNARQRKGQDAWGMTSDTDKWFNDKQKEYSDGLGNDTQRRLFTHTITKLRQSAMGSTADYENSERHRSIEESARASIVGSINIAAAQAADSIRLPKETPVAGVDENGNALPPIPAAASPIPGIKQDIVKRVQVLSQLNGWTPERRDAEEKLHLTNLHTQVIQNLADRYPDEARKYFNANKAEINGSSYDQLDKTMKVAETKQAGFDFVEKNLDWGNIDEESALKAARYHFATEPEKREAAIHEIRTRFAEVGQIRERAQANAADELWSVYGRTGKLSDVPASVLAAVDGKLVATVKEHEAARLAGKNVVTDFNTYYDLKQMAAGNPDAFRKLDLRQYVNKLSPSDREEMVKLQTGDLKEVATLSQQLSNTHDQLKWGSSDKEKKGAFDKAVTDAVSAEQKRTGKAIGYEGRQAVIDRLLIEGDINGMWPGGSRRAYEVQGTPDAKTFVPKISDADKAAIVERFKKRTNREPTSDEVMQTFKKWKGL